MPTNGPGKPPKDDHSRVFDQIRQSPDALPRRPVVNTDLAGPIRPVPFPMYMTRDPEHIPEALSWQAGILDTLTQVVGDQPQSIVADPFPATFVGGSFLPAKKRITVEGNVMPSRFAQPEDLRWTLAHEFGHLLTRNDNAILKAFVDAAPLPKRLNTETEHEKFMAKVWNLGVDKKGYPNLSDTSRVSNYGREYIAGEAFSDMFADALAKRIPEMQAGADNKEEHYPFTPQFRSRSRLNMMDSLVDNLLGRLKSE